MDEFKEALEQIKKDGDALLAKRLEPIEKAIEDKDKSIAEIKQDREGLVKRLENQEQATEDLRKLYRVMKRDSIETDQKEWFKMFGLYAMGVTGAMPSAFEKLNNMGIETKAAAEGTTSGGGALVPEAFVPQLIELIESYGVFRRYAQVVPMPSDSSVWPKLNSDVTVYAPGEAGSITASEPAFANVGLVAKKLAALTAVSSELEEDSAIAIGQIVGRSMARAFARAEDQAGFLGDGTSTYWGFTGITGAFKSHSSYGSQTASGYNGGLVDAAGDDWADITIGNIRTLVSVLPQYAEAGAAFYCSKRFHWDVLVKLAHAAGGLLKAEYERERQVNTFLGYPVRITQVMPSAGNVNSDLCLFFGDLSMGAYLGCQRSDWLSCNRAHRLERIRLGRCKHRRSNLCIEHAFQLTFET